MGGLSYLLYQAAWCSKLTPRGLICGFAAMCDALKKVQKTNILTSFTCIQTIYHSVFSFPLG